MKKLITLLCAVCLLLGIISAQAEEQSPVYALTRIREDGEAELLGSAALVENQTTLITAGFASLPQGTMYAVGSGGRLDVTDVRYACDGSGLVVLTLAQPAPAQPLALGDAEADMTCMALTEQGLVTGGASRVTMAVFEDDGALLYTGLESMKPGAALVNSQGQLAGITAAAFGEGINRYLAYPADTIRAHLAGEGPANGRNELRSGEKWIRDLRVTPDKGCMTVVWNHLPRPEDADDNVYYVVWEDAGNGYYSYTEVKWDDGEMLFGYVPGRSYYVWMLPAHNGQLDTEGISVREAVKVDTEQSAAFTAYAYQDQTLYMTCLPADQPVQGTELLPPAEHLKLGDANMRYYLQAVSTYQVAEEKDAMLVIALKAPDGSVYSMLSGFVFMPELNENDTWNADITGLTDGCVQFAGGVPGKYILCYYLDGLLANECVVTVE